MAMCYGGDLSHPATIPAFIPGKPQTLHQAQTWWSRRAGQAERRDGRGVVDLEMSALPLSLTASRPLKFGLSMKTISFTRSSS
ncbi:hypothetical protein VZT92_016575 [Zoarces viviparus]|uniref:Uncharacterized protein n=1 Tax=Zoarces viviparus TaxID=48416 RepID=A0AAW1ET58_ZOAVI